MGGAEGASGARGGSGAEGARGTEDAGGAEGAAGSDDGPRPHVPDRRGVLRVLCATGRPALDAALAVRLDVVAAVREPRAAAAAAALHLPDAVVLSLEAPEAVVAALVTLGFRVVGLAGAPRATGVGDGRGGLPEEAPAAPRVDALLPEPVTADGVVRALRGLFPERPLGPDGGDARAAAAAVEPFPGKGELAPAGDGPPPGEVAPPAAGVPLAAAAATLRGPAAVPPPRSLDWRPFRPGGAWDARKAQARMAAAAAGPSPGPCETAGAGRPGSSAAAGLAAAGRPVLGALAGMWITAGLVGDPALAVLGAAAGTAAAVATGRLARVRAVEAGWRSASAALRRAASEAWSGASGPRAATPGAAVRSPEEHVLQAAVPLLADRPGRWPVLAARLSHVAATWQCEAAEAARAGAVPVRAALWLSGTAVALAGVLRFARPSLFALLLAGTGRWVLAACLAAEAAGWAILTRLAPGGGPAPLADRPPRRGPPRTWEWERLAEILAALADAGLPLTPVPVDPSSARGVGADAAVLSLPADLRAAILAAAPGPGGELLGGTRRPPLRVGGAAGRPPAPAGGAGSAGAVATAGLDWVRPTPRGRRGAADAAAGRWTATVPSPEARAVLGALGGGSAGSDRQAVAAALRGLSLSWRAERVGLSGGRRGVASLAGPVLVACFLLPLAALAVWPALATVLAVT